MRLIRVKAAGATVLQTRSMAWTFCPKRSAVHLGAALPMLAVANMVMAVPAPSTVEARMLPMCLGGHHPAGRPYRGDQDAPKCPGACHALCGRSQNETERDEHDQES